MHELAKEDMKGSAGVNKATCHMMHPNQWFAESGRKRLGSVRTNTEATTNA